MGHDPIRGCGTWQSEHKILINYPFIRDENGKILKILKYYKKILKLQVSHISTRKSRARNPEIRKNPDNSHA